MAATKHILLSVAFGSAILLGTPTQAAEEANFYFALSAGPQWRAKASDSAGATTFKTGFISGGALGYRLKSHRVEAEYTYFNNKCSTTDPAGPAIGVEPSSGDVDGNILMGNYCFNFPTIKGRLQPFLGGGLGVYRVSINGLTTPSLRTLPAAWGGPVVVYAKSTWTSAYQIKCGVKYKLTDSASLSLGYRYLNGSEMDMNLADGTTIHPTARLQGLEASLHLSF